MNKKAKIEAALLAVLLIASTMITVSNHRRVSLARLAASDADERLRAAELLQQQYETQDDELVRQIDEIKAGKQDKFDTFKLWEKYTQNIIQLTE